MCVETAINYFMNILKIIQIPTEEIHYHMTQTQTPFSLQDILFFKDAPVLMSF